MNAPSKAEEIKAAIAGAVAIFTGLTIFLQYKFSRERVTEEDLAVGAVSEEAPKKTTRKRTAKKTEPAVEVVTEEKPKRKRTTKKATEEAAPAEEAPKKTTRKRTTKKAAAE